MEWQVSLPPHIHAFRSDLAASQLVASENSLVRSEAVSRIYTLVGDLPRLLSPAGERPRSTAAPGPTGSPLHRSCRHHQPAYRFSIAVAIPITSLPISPPPGVTLQAYPLTFKHILSLQAYPLLSLRGLKRVQRILHECLGIIIPCYTRDCAQVRLRSTKP